MISANEFADFLELRCSKKDGYIMGTVGQRPKEISSWYYNQYSGRQKEKALYWREHAEFVWDCQGLADGFVSAKIGRKINVRARNNYAEWCGIRGAGKIPNQYKARGAAVFVDNGRYISHVGYLVQPVDASNPSGDWWVVEARGVMYGVVKTRLSARSWNKWGLMTKYFDYSAKAENEAEYGTRELKRGNVGIDVAAYQRDLISIGYSCGKYGADGEFGGMTEAATEAFQKDHELKIDGIAGENVFEALKKYFEDNADPEHPAEKEKIKIQNGISWNVRNAPTLVGSKVIGYAMHGKEFCVHKKIDGWINMDFNGESAWISEKAVK